MSVSEDHGVRPVMSSCAKMPTAHQSVYRPPTWSLSISGAFLTARCPPLPDEDRAAPIEFRAAKDVQVAWAAGEDMERIVEGFAALAAERLPRHEAIQRAAQLDVDIKRSLRPLLLSAIIEDAVSELLEYQMPS